MGFEKLFEPIKLGKVEIKNRYALAPTSTQEEGLPTELTYAYLAARAKGGAGLIHTGSVQATRMAFEGQRGLVGTHMQLKLYHNSHVPKYAELADTVHAFGAAVFIQLIPGFGAWGEPSNGKPPYSASPVPPRTLPEEIPKQLLKYLKRMPKYREIAEGLSVVETPREMTIEEIQHEQDEYVNSARLAATADFDGIEIHACHGFLLHQFRSPLTNQRKDRYGGSVENRERFTVELVEKTIKALRPDFPNLAIGVRLSAEDCVEGGIPFEETRELTKRLAALGVTHISVTNASRLAMRHMHPDRDATNIEYARAIKEASGLPVLCNNIHDPVTALKAVEEGYVDIVNISRPLLADPELPNKVREGRINEIVKCSRCYFCFVRISCSLPVGCPLNPNVGREKYMPEYWRPIGTSPARILPPFLRNVK